MISTYGQPAVHRREASLLPTYLAVVGPVRPHHPKCWPGTADATRHVFKIQDNECAWIVRLIAGNAHTRPSIGCNVGAVNPHLHVRAGTADEVVVGAIRLIFVSHKAIRRIGGIPK